MHGVSPLGYCPVCETDAQKWVETIAKDGHVRADVNSTRGQTAFKLKSDAVVAKGGDYLGTLIAASW